MHRAVAVADGETLAQRFGEVFLRQCDRGLDRFSLGEISRDGG